MLGRLYRWALAALLFLVACVMAAAFLLAVYSVPAMAKSRGFGPWSGKVELVVLTNSRGPVLRAGRTLWAVRNAFTYTTHAGERITVPAGMVTDLASIPRPFTLLLPPDGPWVSAAVVHDFLYETRGTCTWRGRTGCSRPYTRAEADRVLRDAMDDLGLSGWRVWAIYQGVRIGGGSGWGH